MDKEKECKVIEKPRNVREFFTSWFFWKPFIFVSLGGLAGFLYYYFIGCNSGTCAITSDPLNSIIAGGLLGFFITSGPCTKC